MSSSAYFSSRHHISICPRGHVGLHFGLATIYLTLEEFRSFLETALQDLAQFEGEKPLGGAEERQLCH